MKRSIFSLLLIGGFLMMAFTEGPLPEKAEVVKPMNTIACNAVYPLTLADGSFTGNLMGNFVFNSHPVTRTAIVYVTTSGPRPKGIRNGFWVISIPPNMTGAGIAFGNFGANTTPPTILGYSVAFN